MSALHQQSIVAFILFNLLLSFKYLSFLLAIISDRLPDKPDLPVIDGERVLCFYFLFMYECGTEGLFVCPLSFTIPRVVHCSSVLPASNVVTFYFVIVTGRVHFNKLIKIYFLPINNKCQKRNSVADAVIFFFCDSTNIPWHNPVINSKDTIYSTFFGIV